MQQPDASTLNCVIAIELTDESRQLVATAVKRFTKAGLGRPAPQNVPHLLAFADMYLESKVTTEPQERYSLADQAWKVRLMCLRGMSEPGVYVRHVDMLHTALEMHGGLGMQNCHSAPSVPGHGLCTQMSSGDSALALSTCVCLAQASDCITQRCVADAICRAAGGKHAL